MLKLGNLELGKKPYIAAILDEIVEVDKLKGLVKEGIDIFEIRVDLFKDSFKAVVSYLVELKEEIGIPMIGTIRETDKNRKSRSNQFESIMPFIDAVDIELGSPLSESIRDVAFSKIIIVSEHDFNKTPDNKSLLEMVDRSVNEGAHIVKIATMANSLSDVTRLLRFTEDSIVPMVSIAMGSLGTISRVIAPFFGSLYTYGFIKESVAPGQLHVRELAREIKVLYPSSD